jgi:hypothetical protein
MAVHAHGSASLAPYDGWAEDNICLGERSQQLDMKPGSAQQQGGVCCTAGKARACQQG